MAIKPSAGWLANNYLIINNTYAYDKIDKY